MKNGETVRLGCEDCNVEFEITLEPKTKGGGTSAGEGEDGLAPEYCPYCGSSLPLEDSDDDSDVDEDDDE